MLIRKIQASDNERVADIIREVMTEFGAVGEGYSIEDPEVDSMFQAYSNTRSAFYVVEHEKVVVGCGGIAELQGGDPSTCELKKMYFLESARGKGAGKIMAEMLIVDARRFGYRKIYIETLERMEAAGRLYQQLGFQRLDAPLGKTGHCSCDSYLELEIEPPEIDPALLG